MAYTFYKKNPTDKIYWVYTEGVDGELMISFDGRKVYNLWADYPWKLTPEQKALFDKENPYWANFFKDRV